MPDPLKRLRRSATLTDYGPFKQAMRSIPIYRLYLRDIGRWLHRQYVFAFVRVITAFYHSQLEEFRPRCISRSNDSFIRFIRLLIQPAFVQQHFCIFTDGHSVDYRNRLHSHKGFELWIQYRSINIKAIWIRPVEDDEWNIVLNRRFHVQLHRRNESV